jgi:hypothetical protein
MTEATRRLQNVVQGEINTGKRVVYQTEDQVTLESGKRVNHVLHLIVSLIFWPWSIVWLIFELTGGQKREQVWVDDAGSVNRREIAGIENPMWAKIVAGIIVVLGVLFFASVFA